MPVGHSPKPPVKPITAQEKRRQTREARSRTQSETEEAMAGVSAFSTPDGGRNASPGPMTDPVEWQRQQTADQATRETTREFLDRIEREVAAAVAETHEEEAEHANEETMTGDDLVRLDQVHTPGAQRTVGGTRPTTSRPVPNVTLTAPDTIPETSAVHTPRQQRVREHLP